VALTTADPLTLYLTYTNHIFGPGSWEKWFVGLPLIAALALSVLNAIMGCGRSLYQAAEDGQLPRWFEKKNRHGVPGNAMAFNLVCSAILVLLGSPLRIYIISNGGYLLSCSLALAGYFVYRQLRPDGRGRSGCRPSASGSPCWSSWPGWPSTSSAAGTRRRSSWPTRTRVPGCTCSAC
jgi:amino acid transporter